MYFDEKQKKTNVLTYRIAIQVTNKEVLSNKSTCSFFIKFLHFSPFHLRNKVGSLHNFRKTKKKYAFYSKRS